MNQYSTEAAAQQASAHRAEQRRKLIKSLIRIVFLLILLGIAGAAYMYRGQVGTSLSKLKMRSNAEMRKARAEGKAVEAQKMARKRVDEFEATLK